MIIGTAGHVDHGKTSLVRALSGVDTDRLLEEKARGISIDLGFAYVPGPDGSVIGFVDVPGHERFIHNMLAGATGIDYLLLAVAADDGIMPQTLEHLAIADLLGVERGVVALTKADLVPRTRLEAVKAELAALLSGTGLAGAETIETSVTSGEGVEALRAHLLAAATADLPRTRSGLFRLSVDRCFTLPGAGTIVTGTVLSGSVAVGDKIRVSPSGLTARVRSIHAQNRAAERGHAGERCALNLVGESVTKEAIARGEILLDPALHAPTERIDARLRVLAGESRDIQQWLPVRLHCGADALDARLVVLEDEPLRPGGSGWVQLVLDRPIAAACGDRFILRDCTAQRTIGGGRFTELRPPARKRRTPERRAQLEALALAEPAAALARYLDLPPFHADLSAFARDRAQGEIEIEGLVRLTAEKTVYGMTAPRMEAYRGALLATLAAFHVENPDVQGLGRERLRTRLEPRLPAPLFGAVLQFLARDGLIATDGAWVRLPGHQAKLTPAHEALWVRIAPRLGGEERFRPPRVRDLAGTLELPENVVRALLKLASRLGRVDEVAQDHFFLRATMAEIVALALALGEAAPEHRFSAAELRDRLGNGRKVAIQILEFLDRHGVTLRRGDLRRINPHRLDLFGQP